MQREGVSRTLLVKGAKKGHFFTKKGATRILRQDKGFRIDLDKFGHPIFSDNQWVFALIRTISAKKGVQDIQR